ncbi:hypothetical protein T4B_7261 [Trichinella pseudospiralis]|uniref:Uncharacterized protein n=1 Tax=Trichinella pseudospiralis TaxID=6337 RepID=A0A0V1IL25_TRIPS|nr:hypothetical protein T4B_7261 [Trichinella pseudospiralis]
MLPSGTEKSGCSKVIVMRQHLCQRSLRKKHQSTRDYKTDRLLYDGKPNSLPATSRATPSGTSYTLMLKAEHVECDPNLVDHLHKANHPSCVLQLRIVKFGYAENIDKSKMLKLLRLQSSNLSLYFLWPNEWTSADKQCWLFFWIPTTVNRMKNDPTIWPANGECLFFSYTWQNAVHLKHDQQLTRDSEDEDEEEEEEEDNDADDDDDDDDKSQKEEIGEEEEEEEE